MDKRKVLAKRMCLISLILLAVIEGTTGLKLLVAGINGRLIELILGIMVIGLPMYLFDYSKKKNIKIIFNILLCFIIFVSIIFYVLFFSENEYFYYKSPDQERTLIVEETAFLLAGQSNFYENKYGIFIKPLNKYILTDDGFRPFTFKEYNIKWENNHTAIIDYSVGNGFNNTIKISF